MAALRVHDGPRWTLGVPDPVEGAGDVVETDDLTNGGKGVEPAFADRVEGAVPVLGLGAASELDRNPPVRRSGAIERVAGVPAACCVDAGAHRRRVHQLLDQTAGTYALEHERSRRATFERELEPHVEG